MGEWDGPTPVDLDPSDILELDGDATTPPRGLDTLPGYDLGELRGAAKVLHALRDELLRQGNTPAFADAFIRRLATLAGVTLG